MLQTQAARRGPEHLFFYTERYLAMIATEKKIFLGSEHVSLCHVFIDKFTATDYMQMLVLPQITVLYQLKHLSYLFFL